MWTHEDSRHLKHSFWAKSADTPYLFEAAHIVGLQIHELAIFFKKRTPFNLVFVQEIDEKF